MHHQKPRISLDTRSHTILKLAEFTHTSLSVEMTHESNQPFINAVMEEIERSPEILPSRIMQLEVKSDAIHEQQAIFRWVIETQIVLYLSTL